MKKGIGKAVVLCVAACLLSGCVQSIELTESEQEIIADYAANVLLEYDRNYNDKYVADETAAAKAQAKDTLERIEAFSEEPQQSPEAEPSPTPKAEETPVPDASQVLEVPTPAPQQQPQQAMTPAEIGSMFGMDNVEVNYIGFETLAEYPVLPDDQVGFVMRANPGTELVVVKFELVNRAEEARSCNVVGQNIKFQLRFNGTDAVAVQKTMLQDDFAALNCVLQPGETKQVVVVAQVAGGYSAGISTVEMIVRIGGENKLLKLQ